MYEAYYGLREKPFNLTPDPKYLYLSEKHKEAFAHLLFGIKNRSGFVMVTGEIGTGKTTICRTLLGQLDENTEVAFIFNPSLSPEELLRKINEDFGIQSQASSVKGLIDELNAYLLDRNTKGKNCVLVIDEAQNLTPTVLEQIRMLSNLETETQKLLQIVLIGQPELMQVLSLHELRQLNQRITARYHLHALGKDETLQYVAYRMRVAGARRRIYFTASAIKRVFKLSGGTPRVINALCDRALLIGYTKEVRDITPSIVQQAAKEIRGEQPRKKVWPQIRAWLPNPAVVTAGVAIVLLAVFLRDRNVFVPTPTAPPATSTASNQPAPAPRTEPNVALAAQVPLEKPVRDIAPQGPTQIDTTFAGMIDRQDLAACRNASVQAILTAWNIALMTNLPADDSVDALTKFATDNHLTTEVMTVTLEQLEAINLPALIKLHGHSRSVWAAVVGAQGDDLKLALGPADPLLYPRDRVNECYLNEAIVLWRDPAPDATPLRAGMKGEDVRVLQVQLGALGKLERTPTGEYDQQTADAIRRIQKDTGQKIDGATGRRTRMVLSSWLPGFNTPGLRAMPSVLMRDVSDGVEPKRPAPDATATPPSTAATTPAPAPESDPKKQAKAAPVEKPKPDVAQKPTQPKVAEHAPAPAPPAPAAKPAPVVPAPTPAAPAPAPVPAAPAATPPPAAPAETKPTAETVAPAVKAEELPTPSAQPPATPPPTTNADPSAPASPPAPTEAEKAAPTVSNETPPAGDAAKPENKGAAPGWTGGLPLVPSEPGESGGTP